MCKFNCSQIHENCTPIDCSVPLIVLRQLFQQSEFNLIKHLLAETVSGWAAICPDRLGREESREAGNIQC